MYNKDWNFPQTVYYCNKTCCEIVKRKWIKVRWAVSRKSALSRQILDTNIIELTCVLPLKLKYVAETVIGKWKKVRWAVSRKSALSRQILVTNIIELKCVLLL